MSLLPHDASFHERVADLFTAFRGRGVSLSALDVELVDVWAKSGAPFEVVARKSDLRRAGGAAVLVSMLSTSVMCGPLWPGPTRTSRVSPC